MTIKPSRRPLSEQVYTTIREAIVSLKLLPGQMIYENELAKTLNVSRTPVREAIRSLVNEELLEVLPQRGTQVTYISERKVLETSFIRMQLEIGAFRIAANIWDPSRKNTANQSIMAILEEQKLAAEKNDISLFLQLDESFHRAILELAGNETLMNVVYHMRGHLNRLRYLVVREYHRSHEVIGEHEKLVSAIQCNDGELVAKLLAEHLGKLQHEIPDLRRAFPNYFVD